jgi:translation elongation factor EF-1beta
MHVVMNDGEGLVDAFEHRVNGIVGIGEVEVLEMGLL